MRNTLNIKNGLDILKNLEHTQLFMKLLLSVLYL